MKSFWSQGLRFECTQCGACCQGEPGVIYFSPEEFERLVAHFAEAEGLSREAVIQQYMRPHLDSYSARDDLPGGRCIFYENGCTIYELRPSQCRDFPFWRANLRSEQAWKRCAKDCPGIGRGRLWSAEEILEIASRSRI